MTLGSCFSSLFEHPHAGEGAGRGSAWAAAFDVGLRMAADVLHRQHHRQDPQQQRGTDAGYSGGHVIVSAPSGTQG